MLYAIVSPGQSMGGLVDERVRWLGRFVPACAVVIVCPKSSAISLIVKIMSAGHVIVLFLVGFEVPVHIRGTNPGDPTTNNCPRSRPGVLTTVKISVGWSLFVICDSRCPLCPV